MDPVRFGLALRALRRRRGWDQATLAARAGLSQASVSRCEGGAARDLTWRTLDRLVEALDAKLTVSAFWQGEALDRLLDAAHAEIVEAIVRLLESHGWEVIPEATFSIFGERGSIDILAFHPATGIVLVVEVKSAVPDMQGMLAGIDRKVRLAPAIARERKWAVTAVARLLVLPDSTTTRRRLAKHARTVRQTMPAGTVEARRWLAGPDGAFGGVMFLPNIRSTDNRHRVGRKRIAKRSSAGPSTSGFGARRAQNQGLGPRSEARPGHSGAPGTGIRVADRLSSGEYPSSG